MLENYIQMKCVKNLHQVWKLFHNLLKHQLTKQEKFLDTMHYLKDFNVSMKIKLMDFVKIIKLDIVAIMMKLLLNVKTGLVGTVVIFQVVQEIGN